MKLRQTDKDLILRDADDHELAIPLSTLDTQEISKSSLMPVGLADGLTRAELVDLVRFLSELGKIGPYSMSKAPIARTWQALAPSPAVARTLSAIEGTGKILSGDPDLIWTPAYSRVSGDLPVAELPKYHRPSHPALAAVRCRLEVLSGGALKFKIDNPSGVSVWLDKKPVDIATGAAEAAEGRHVITIEIDASVHPQPIRLELIESRGSTARRSFSAASSRRSVSKRIQLNREVNRGVYFCDLSNRRRGRRSRRKWRETGRRFGSPTLALAS